VKEGTYRNMVVMEAAAVSAAVSGMLKLVGNKLAPLVIKEYSAIVCERRPPGTPISSSGDQ
jgi:hypothetical protein